MTRRHQDHGRPDVCDYPGYLGCGHARIELERDLADLAPRPRLEALRLEPLTTPIARSRSSMYSSASRFSRSCRATSRSTAGPVMRNAPSPPAPTRSPARSPGGRPRARAGGHAVRRRASSAQGRVLAKIGRPSSPDAVALEPGARASPGGVGISSRSSAAGAPPTAPAGPRRPRAAAGRPCSARTSDGRRSRPAPYCSSSRAHRQVVVPRVGAGRAAPPRRGGPAARVRSTWARNSWPSPAPAPPLDQAGDVGQHELAALVARASRAPARAS